MRGRTNCLSLRGPYVYPFHEHLNEDLVLDDTEHLVSLSLAHHVVSSTYAMSCMGIQTTLSSLSCPPLPPRSCRVQAAQAWYSPYEILALESVRRVFFSTSRLHVVVSSGYGQLRPTTSVCLMMFMSETSRAKVFLLAQRWNSGHVTQPQPG